MMSATTQNRSSKQSQGKQKAGEPPRVRIMQATTEQLRMAELLQRSETSPSDAEIAEKVATLRDAANCSEEDALLALDEADNDSNRALNLLLERLRSGTDSEWQQATAKKTKKAAGVAPSNDDSANRETHAHAHAHTHTHSERDAGNGKRPRRGAARGRHVAHNGDVEQTQPARAPRGHRRPPRSNDAAAASQHVAEGDASQANAVADAAPLNGDGVRSDNDHVEDATGKTADEWQSARTRGDNRLRRRTEQDADGQAGDGVREYQGDSARRGRGSSLVSRGPGSVTVRRGGGAAVRGRSAGGNRGAWRTYSRTPRSDEQPDDANKAVPARAQNAPRRGEPGSRSRPAYNRPSRANRGDQTQPASTLQSDEWVNDEWEGGPGSWQNTETRVFEAVGTSQNAQNSDSTQQADAHAEIGSNSVSSFASIVAQRNASAAAQQTTVRTASAAAQPPTTAPVASVQPQNAPSVRPPQPASTPQPVSASPRPSAPTPQTSVAATQQVPHAGASTSLQHQHTQKIDLADLLSKSSGQPSSVAPQTAAAARSNAPFGSAPTAIDQSVPHAAVSASTTFTPAASQPLPAPANLAVGSQTHFGVGRPSAQPRLLQDEAVVMPFKLSESLSSAFQFGFNADYVNPSPAPAAPSAPAAPAAVALDATSRPQTNNAAYAQSAPSTTYTQPQASAVASQQQQQQTAASQAAQTSRTQSANAFGSVSQAQSFSGASQQAASPMQAQPVTSVNTVTSNLNRMTLGNEAQSASSMKATANTFVPAHAGNTVQHQQQQHQQQQHQQQQHQQHQQQQAHPEPTATAVHSRNDTQQFSNAQQFFAFAASHQQAFAGQHHSTATGSHSQQQQTTNTQQSHASPNEAALSSQQQMVATSVGMPQQHHQQVGAISVASSAQAKPNHAEASRQIGVNVGLGVPSSQEDSGIYTQTNRGQAGPGHAAGTQASAQFQHVFNQLAANLFGANASSQTTAGGQSAPPAQLTGAGGFNPPGAPGQTQQFSVPPYAVFQPATYPQAAYAQQFLSLLAPQNAAQPQFASVSQPQSAATGTPTQSSAPQFGAAPQFGIGLHSTMVSGASGNQSGSAQSGAPQQNAAAKLLAATGANLYAGDEQNAFGASNMFGGADYQRGAVGFQSKGGSNDYPAYKPQAQLGVGVVGASMLDKSGASTYYGAAGANQVGPSSNPPPGLGTSPISGHPNFNMYAPPNPTAHQYLMTQTGHPGMYVPNVVSAGPIGAQKGATPTKPPGFQPPANWQQQY